MDISIAGFRAGRTDSDRYDRIGGFRKGKRLTDCIGEKTGVQDEGVGRGHDNIGIGMADGDFKRFCLENFDKITEVSE